MHGFNSIRIVAVISAAGCQGSQQQGACEENSTFGSHIHSSSLAENNMYR
ncbi:hypothetical protein [Paenibacillus sp. FSL K6-2859]